MVFDSCLSEAISALVREFIAAGKEDEPVPDRSVFNYKMVCSPRGNS